MNGCLDTERVQKNESDRQINSQLINTYNDIALQNAIIRQHTLYPYHFVDNSDKLNDLGIRDFGILAKHFAENPGNLNINQGDASAELYYKRVVMISEQLKASGVDISRVQIADAMPGGDGITTERMLKVLEKAEKAPSSESDQYMSGSGTGTGMGIGSSK